MNKTIFRSHLRRLRSESGQSLVLVASVLISFLLFFGFAINTGLLVTAKISLQSAADAAAYAGAATQARQLNAISFLNYDMRRQYKKFVHRYSFVASLGNPHFFEISRKPELVANEQYLFNKQDYSAGSTSPRLNPIGVPSVCIPLTTGSQNDNCLFINLPNTSSSFKGPGLSNISKLLYQQLQAIADIQKGLCEGNSAINFFVLMNWLFKAKPDNNDLITLFNTVAKDSNLSANDKNKALQTIGTLIEGLGLFPRNILNLLRIETLVQIINQNPQVATLEAVQSWENAPSADQHERTILAFRSALANLNETVMNPSQVEMIELQAAKQLEVLPVTASFNAFVHFMDNSGQRDATGKTICQASILPFPVVGAPVGIRKSSATPVHYAVKVRARARLLFLPMSDGLELEAVAAAKPFGARMGPQNLQESDFVRSITPGKVNGQPILKNDCAANLGCKVPDLSVDGGAVNYYSARFIEAVRSLVPQNNVDANSLRQAMRAATAPFPSEVGRYNILPPPKPTQGQTADAPSMEFEFIPYSDSNNSQFYRFYAPLFLANQGNTTQRINQIIDRTFGDLQLTGDNPFRINKDELRSEIQRRIANYVNGELSNGTGSEFQESLTFAALDLPMSLVPPPPMGQPYWITQESIVRTAWGPDRSRISGGRIGFQSRFGYSVKFVTLQNLLQSGMPDPDDELSKISH